jgi:hypothetical protein
MPYHIKGHHDKAGRGKNQAVARKTAERYYEINEQRCERKFLTYHSCQAQGPALQARGLAVVDALLLGGLRLALDLPPPPQLLLQVLLDQGQVAVVLLDLLKHTHTHTQQRRRQNTPPNERRESGVKTASRTKGQGRRWTGKQPNLFAYFAGDFSPELVGYLAHLARLKYHTRTQNEEEWNEKQGSHLRATEGCERRALHM